MAELSDLDRATAEAYRAAQARHGLTPDQLIVVRAIDLIVGVSPAVVARAVSYRDARDRGEWIGSGSKPGVNPRDLAELVDAIEASYPGVIEDTRRREAEYRAGTKEEG